MNDYLQLITQIDWSERDSVASELSSVSVDSTATSGFISGGCTSASGSIFGDSSRENDTEETWPWIPKNKKDNFLLQKLVMYVYRIVIHIAIVLQYHIALLPVRKFD